MYFVPRAVLSLSQKTYGVRLTHTTYRELGTLNTVRQLVEKAEGLMGDAFTGRAVLHRERENLKKEVIQVDIKGIITAFSGTCSACVFSGVATVSL